jgi:hypothetical protein
MSPIDGAIVWRNGWNSGGAFGFAWPVGVAGSFHVVKSAHLQTV